MAYIELDLTLMLFEDEIEIWHGDDEEPESTTTLFDLFDGYANSLMADHPYRDAKEYVETTLADLERGKGLLLDTLEEMKQRETR